MRLTFLELVIPEIAGPPEIPRRHGPASPNLNIIHHFWRLYTRPLRIGYPVLTVSATPILDLEQDPPAPGSGKWTVLIYLVIGSAIGIGADSLGVKLPQLNFLVWIPLLYIAISIHELGHLLAGKMTCMASGGIVVGGFVAMKSGDHWTVRFDPRRIFGSGMAIPLPGKDGFEAGRFAWMVAAGPIASIATTYVCWLAFRRFGDGAGGWIGSSVWASAIGLASLIPMSSGIHKSDAARLWILLTRPDQSRSWMAAVTVQAENARGVRPRDWDAALVEQMLAAPGSGSEQLFPHLMAFLRCLDERNESLASEHLEKALAASGRSGKAVRQTLYLQAAEVNALLKNNAEAARTWLDRALKLRKPESRTCTDSAIAMCEGRYDDALKHIAATRAFLLKRKLDSGLARFSHDWLDERESVCRNAMLAGAHDQPGIRRDG